MALTDRGGDRSGGMLAKCIEDGNLSMCSDAWSDRQKTAVAASAGFAIAAGLLFAFNVTAA
jgi:hypothetical protein